MSADKDASQQDDPGQHLDQNVTHGGGAGSFRSPGQDQEYGSHHHQFPENEQGDHVAGEHGAQRTARIEHAGDAFRGVL